MINAGDRVKVIDQEIIGVVIEDYGTSVVIEEDDSEFEDNRLEYKKSELEKVMTLEQQHKIEDALNRDLTPEEIAIIDDDLTGDYEVDDIVELILAD